MKCLDCGFDIDELDEHEGHEVVPGSFEESGWPEVLAQSDELVKILESCYPIGGDC